MSGAGGGNLERFLKHVYKSVRRMPPILTFIQLPLFRDVFVTRRRRFTPPGAKTFEFASICAFPLRLYVVYARE